MTPSIMNSDPEKLKSAFHRLYEIVSLLRGPRGCPWDREQTLASMRSNLIEETYECIEAIEEKAPPLLREELGDLFLILVLLARMNEEEGVFDLVETLEEIIAKLIRRHPHVFGNKQATSVPEVIKNWEYIKEHIEGKKKRTGLLEDINQALPPLEKAVKIQKKAARIGFDWPSVAPVFEKLKEELEELQSAIRQKNAVRSEEEVGDLLFTVVNIARHLNVDPGLALAGTNKKFIKRFRRIEEELRAMHVELQAAGLELLDSLWEKVKKEASNTGAR